MITDFVGVFWLLLLLVVIWFECFRLVFGWVLIFVVGCYCVHVCVCWYVCIWWFLGVVLNWFVLIVYLLTYEFAVCHLFWFYFCCFAFWVLIVFFCELPCLVGYLLCWCFPVLFGFWWILLLLRLGLLLGCLICLWDWLLYLIYNFNSSDWFIVYEFALLLDFVELACHWFAMFDIWLLLASFHCLLFYGCFAFVCRLIALHFNLVVDLAGCFFV